MSRQKILVSLCGHSKRHIILDQLLLVIVSDLIGRWRDRWSVTRSRACAAGSGRRDDADGWGRGFWKYPILWLASIGRLTQ
jgi:hypothetical protein